MFEKNNRYTKYILGLRIPKALAELLNLQDGSKVNIALEDHKLIISTLSESKLAEYKKLVPKNRLNKLVSKVTAKNRPNLDDGDYDIRGKEIW